MTDILADAANRGLRVGATADLRKSITRPETDRKLVYYEAYRDMDLTEVS